MVGANPLNNDTAALRYIVCVRAYLNSTIWQNFSSFKGIYGCSWDHCGTAVWAKGAKCQCRNTKVPHSTVAPGSRSSCRRASTVSTFATRILIFIPQNLQTSRTYSPCVNTTKFPTNPSDSPFCTSCSQQRSSFFTSHGHGSNGHGQTPDRRSGIKQAFCGYIRGHGAKQKPGPILDTETIQLQASRTELLCWHFQGWTRLRQWLRRPRHHILRRLSAPTHWDRFPHVFK